MQHRKATIIPLIALAVLLLDACSNTRFLTGDQMLYTGRNKVVVTDTEKGNETRAAIAVAKDLTFRKPNGALLGTVRVLPPLRLWTYNYLKPRKEGKKPGWLYRTFSSEPVLISVVNPEQRCRKIESELFGIGYFNSRATFILDTNEHNPRKAKISYTIQVNNPYHINKVLKATPENSFDSLLNTSTQNLKIKPGDVFSIETIRSEKRRIAATLVEQGFYFFGPENIQVVADTTGTMHQINLMIGKGPETPVFVCTKYTIGKVIVNLYDVQSDIYASDSPSDTVFFDGIIITGLKNYLHPEVITRSILFRNGDLYSTSKHQGTIIKLNNYGVFRYVKLQFAIQDTANQELDLKIELAPRDDISLNLEGFVQSKSSGFVGPGAEVTLAHANIARGANTLQLKMSGGFEWQIGSKSADELGNNSYNLGINTSFVFPRLVLPFKTNEQSKLLATKSIGTLGFEFLNNVMYYRMNSVNIGFGYQWKKRQKITHVFYPFKINMVNLLKTTPEFDTIVASNPYVKKSFEEQTIVGMEYDFTYDNTARKSNCFYLQGIVSTSGNLVDLVNSAGSSERPYTVLGNVYSQFVKTSVDLRYYTGSIKKGIVFRLYSGVGFSYLNSSVMPYIEQFYSGGSNSIRAFTARSLGPGSYKPVDYNGIIDQTGDIKLEFNLEYRFPFSKTILGALFADAGNVWLLNPDENRPGAEFKLKNFTSQFALGTGLGLRFDFDFFVLRTDLGFPLRTPYLTGNSNWLVPDDIFHGFRLNLSIGYPF